MTYNFYLSDENGKNPIDVEFYIDDSDLAIESAEIKTQHEQTSVIGNWLQFWINACGGKNEIIRKAIASTIPDDCSLAKSRKEYGEPA